MVSVFAGSGRLRQRPDDTRCADLQMDAEPPLKLQGTGHRDLIGCSCGRNGGAGGGAGRNNGRSGRSWSQQESGMWDVGMLGCAMPAVGTTCCVGTVRSERAIGIVRSTLCTCTA
jgi:hypothetical protein